MRRPAAVLAAALLAALALAAPMAAQDRLDGYPLYDDRRAMIRTLTDLATAGDYPGLIRALSGTRAYSEAEVTSLAEKLDTIYGPSLDRSDILYHRELSGSWVEEVLAFWPAGGTDYFYINIVSHKREEGIIPVWWRYNSDIEGVLPSF
ncbi:hypothetical protein [Celeribacter indicus]|uniref:DUF3887 domain-containing protein n=1 Tax=Celeribacter indicus TaxID=1208324 RepID=A0A0B5E4S4_9RHOB|nr:hypothetical protein [Celeribacter indicus]AJE47367.1 hypothetical protein P73_2652 [Celeribacter indicus]SDW04704.1 hypothetical protein SAMN05443573_101210 [Celeribacter indicus]